MERFGHLLDSDVIATGKSVGSWPDPNASPASIGPIAVLQPASAAFLRDGQVRFDGSLGHQEQESTHPDRPTALVGIVCRGRSPKHDLRVERQLVGAGSAQFQPMDLDLEKERCAQIRDLIPAGTMTAGLFRYEVRVLDKGIEVASASREFAVFERSMP